MFQSTANFCVDLFAVNSILFQTYTDKEVKTEGYYKTESGVICYMRLFTDGCSEKITRYEGSDMAVVGKYPPYDEKKALEFLKDMNNLFKSWDEKEKFEARIAQKNRGTKNEE